MSSFSVLWIPLLEAAQPDFAGRCLCPTLASVHPFSVVPNPFIGPHIVFNPLLHFFPHLIPIWFHFWPNFAQHQPKSKTEVSTRMSVKAAAKNFLEGFGHLACSPASPEDGKEPNIGKQHVNLKPETKLGSTC